MSDQTTMLEAIRSRTRTKSEFGYGITTADRYFSEFRAAGDNLQRLAKLMGSGSVLKVTECEREASEKLVYANPDMVVEEKATSVGSFKDVLPQGVEVPKHTLMVFRNVLTTPREDRDMDELVTEGAVVDPKMPLLSQHMHMLPIGKMLSVIDHTKDVLRLATVLLDLNELTEDTAKLIEADVLRFSHGFRPLEWEERQKGGDFVGFRVTKFEIMEESLVSVPSNVDAEMEMFSRGKLKSELFRNHAKAIFDARPVSKPGYRVTEKMGDYERTIEGFMTPDELRGYVGKRQEPEEKAADGPPEHKAIQPSHTKHFDVDREYLEASKLEYEWASRFIGCQIKQMLVCSTRVPAFRMGSYLTGIHEHTRTWDLKDTRNITYEGKEEPPLHEHVELNSTKSETFMVEGLQFWRTDKGKKVCVKYVRTWNGMVIITYAAKEDYSGEKLIGDSWSWAIENNFLKGEAFCLAGGFIKREGASWEDVFLEDRNKRPAMKATRLINERGKDMSNRGIIMMGPPGTGKTLSGRIMLNEANASFIWVSARDFWMMGATHGLCTAFDLARELAPSIIFVEDVDNWMSERTVDVVKTEMDGIAQSKGVLTVMTTNYPERLPSALIDRPGRFHDVLKFDLPSAKVRGDMLRTWTEGVSDEEIQKVVKRTEGYSGAHMYELVSFAKTLSDEDDVDLGKALDSAVSKIDQQRELIDRSQLSGSRYRHYSGSKFVVKPWDAVDLGIKGPDGEPLKRYSKSLCQSIKDQQEITAEEAASVLILKGDPALLHRVRKSIDALLEVEAAEAMAKEFRELIGQ